MAKALSVDRRERVLAAVDAGISCPQAAVRFRVSASSAIRWNDQRRKQGDFTPKPQGGDRRSGRIETNCIRRICDEIETLKGKGRSLGGNRRYKVL
jgi:transposase